MLLLRGCQPLHPAHSCCTSCPGNACRRGRPWSGPPASRCLAWPPPQTCSSSNGEPWPTGTPDVPNCGPGSPPSEPSTTGSASQQLLAPSSPPAPPPPAATGPPRLARALPAARRTHREQGSPPGGEPAPSASAAALGAAAAWPARTHSRACPAAPPHPHPPLLPLVHPPQWRVPPEQPASGQRRQPGGAAGVQGHRQGRPEERGARGGGADPRHAHLRLLHAHG